MISEMFEEGLSRKFIQITRVYSTKIAEAYQRGLFHVIISIAFVQGTVYVLQVMAARLLDPATFGIIRSAEVMISVLLIIASGGMPTVAIKTASQNLSNGHKQILAGRLIKITIFSSLLCVFFVLSIKAAFFKKLDLGFFSKLSWIVIVSSCCRVCVNYFYGIGQVKKISNISITASLIAFALVTFSTAQLQSLGWILGRYLGELLLFMLCLWGIAPKLQGALPEYFSVGRLLGIGVPSAGGLALRACLDNLGILMLQFAGATSTRIGYLGLATLLINGALLPISAAMNLLVPQFVKLKEYRSSLMAAYFSLNRKIIKYSIVSVVFVFAAGDCIPLLFGKEYTDAVLLLRVLALTIPARAIASNAGGILLVFGKTVFPFVVNGVLLIVIALSCVIAVKHGDTALAVVIVCGEWIGMVVYYIRCRYLLITTLDQEIVS